jgi:hypothetical protein
MSSGMSGGNLYSAGSNGLSGKIKTRGVQNVCAVELFVPQDKAARGVARRRAHEDGSARHGYQSESCFLAAPDFRWVGRRGKNFKIGNFRFQMEATAKVKASPLSAQILRNAKGAEEAS